MTEWPTFLACKFKYSYASLDLVSIWSPRVVHPYRLLGFHDMLPEGHQVVAKINGIKCVSGDAVG